jgi:hypothetical protein
VTRSIERVLEDNVWRTVSRSLASLLGPYRISFDTPDIATDYIPVPGAEVLPLGTVVLDAWVFPVDSWENEGGRLHIGVAQDHSNFLRFWHLGLASQGNASGSLGNVVGLPNDELATNQRGVLIGDPDTRLFCTIDSVAAQGSSSIYALAVLAG